MVSRLRTLVQKLLLVYGFMLLFIFVLLRVFFINTQPQIVILSVLLAIAELHILLQFFTMLYSLWPRKYTKYEVLNTNKNVNIHMFICVCGEPADIVRRTAQAAIIAQKAYCDAVAPHTKPKIVILNDGYAAGKSDWQEIERVATELNIYHIARAQSKGFKAGNINHALATVSSPDAHNTYDIILDADFAVTPEFLTEITKPFVDNSIDFVQTPQRYSNETTWVAQAAAAHQIHFFSHVCDAKAHHNALFLCGTNFAIRRSALNAVGGMDERFITEDYATSINLHLAGKRGTFINKPLAYGIAPSTLKAYFSQQQRWSKGTFDTSFAYARQLLFGTLSMRQKFQYLISSLYYLSGIRNALLIIAPLPYLFFGTVLMKGNIPEFFFYVYGPFCVYNLLTYFFLFRHPLKSWVLDMISFPVYVSAFFSSVFKRELAFIVTIKKHQSENILRVYSIQITIALALFAGLIYAVIEKRIAYSAGQFMNYFWVVFNISVLFLGFFLYIKDSLLMSEGGFAQIKNHHAHKKVKMFERMVVLPLFVVLVALTSTQIHHVRVFARAIAQQANTQLQQFGRVSVLDVPAKGAYFGYYLPQFNTHPQNPNVYIAPKTKGSIAMFYQDWSTGSGFDERYMSALESEGVIPVVTWEPWNARLALPSKANQSLYAPKRIVQGDHDDYIRSWARAAAAHKKPFFIRFAHEMNGNWYPWAVAHGNSPKQYRAMWRRVHRIFEQEGATNVLWVWAPNNESFMEKGVVLNDYYPGDDVVDWVGFSGFNWGDTDSSRNRPFGELTKDIYQELSAYQKPMMVAETATVGSESEKSKWYTQMAQSLPNMPSVKAVVIFNQDFNEFAFAFGGNTQVTRVMQKEYGENPYFVHDPITYDTMAMFQKR